MLLILLDNLFPPLVFILQLPASLVSLKIETSEVWPCVTCAGGLRGGGRDESPLCGGSVSLLQKLCWRLHLILPPASSIPPPSCSPSPAPAWGQFEDFPAIVPPSHDAAVGDHHVEGTACYVGLGNAGAPAARGEAGSDGTEGYFRAVEASQLRPGSPCISMSPLLLLFVCS